MQLPAPVELAVARTEPGVRGDTASLGVTKTATLETGLEIRVPLFIKEGERGGVRGRAFMTISTSLPMQAAER
jgi:hypothetical protein